MLRSVDGRQVANLTARARKPCGWYLKAADEILMNGVADIARWELIALETALNDRRLNRGDVPERVGALEAADDVAVAHG